MPFQRGIWHIALELSDFADPPADTDYGGSVDSISVLEGTRGEGRGFKNIGPPPGHSRIPCLWPGCFFTFVTRGQVTKVKKLEEEIAKKHSDSERRFGVYSGVYQKLWSAQAQYYV